MKRSLLKKAVACVSSLALACALMPAAALTAFADDDSSLTIDEDTVFYVQATDTATGETEVLKTYTEQELAEVTENYPTMSYAYSGAVRSTSSYVTMDTLLDGVEQFDESAYVQFECYDGSYTKWTYTYEYANTTKYFYPNNVVTDAASNTLSTDATSATAVPDVIALGSQSVSFTDEQPTLKDLVDTESADDTWRFLTGVTESGTYNAGRLTPSGVEGITVVYDSTYDAGTYSDGYEDGYADGADSVDTDSYYNEGYAAGLVDGAASVDTEASYDEGYAAGYAAGLVDGAASVDTDASYSEGYAAGLADGAASVDTDSYYATGYAEGYAAGLTDGAASVDTDSYYQSGYTDGADSVDTNAYYADGYNDGVNASEASADDSTTTTEATVTTKATQELSIAVATKSMKVKKLKTKKRTVKALTVSGAKGKVTYKKTGGSKKLTVNASTGKITVKKGTKKGTYKIKVRVKAAATSKYAASSTIVTVKVKVVK